MDAPVHGIARRNIRVSANFGSSTGEEGADRLIAIPSGYRAIDLHAEVTQHPVGVCLPAPIKKSLLNSEEGLSL